MKKAFLTLMIAFVAMVAVKAQQIAVVSASGETKMYKTFADAISGATSGSTIYLPGGVFSISDDVKITQKITIIGIGHKVTGGNVDGNTIIAGNLFFNEGSSGSAVMGCYISGNVVIGEDGPVNDVLVRYCNFNSVQVMNNQCQDTFINQNYIRNTSDFGGTNATITNNVLHSLKGLINGVVTYNVILNAWEYGRTSSVYYPYVAAVNADFSSIKFNLFDVTSTGIWRLDHINGTYMYYRGSDNIVYKNLAVKTKTKSSLGEGGILLETENWDDVLENFIGGSINTNANFKFKGDYVDYNKTIGIYAGTGFNDDQLAPVPYIVAKSIPEQTDAEGKLNIKIRVKAGE